MHPTPQVRLFAPAGERFNIEERLFISGSNTTEQVTLSLENVPPGLQAFLKDSSKEHRFQFFRQDNFVSLNL